MEQFSYFSLVKNLCDINSTEKTKLVINLTVTYFNEKFIF